MEIYACNHFQCNGCLPFGIFIFLVEQRFGYSWVYFDGWMGCFRHCSDRRLQMIEFTTQAWRFCVCVCCASCFSDWSIIIDYSGKCVFLMLSPTLVQDHYVNNDFWFATTSTTTLLLWIKNEIDWNIVSTILFHKEKSSNLIISYFDKWLAIMCRTSRFFFFETRNARGDGYCRSRIVRFDARSFSFHVMMVIIERYCCREINKLRILLLFEDSYVNQVKFDIYAQVGHPNLKIEIN